jgi:hypothetical protein
MKSHAKALARLLITAPLALIGLHAAESAVKSTFITLDTPETAEVRKLGESAINRMAVSMVREVSAALANGGAERAVDGLVVRGRARIHRAADHDAGMRSLRGGLRRQRSRMTERQQGSEYDAR